MPATTVSASPASEADSIPVRTITNADADAALREGWGDFMEMRGDLIFVGLIYVLVGVVAATAVMGGALLPLLFPIVAGVGLLGPVAALGFYEMARRRESGLQSNWQHFLDVRKRPGANEIGVVAALLLGIFVAWMFVASGLYLALFGWWEPPSISAFLVSRFHDTRRLGADSHRQCHRPRLCGSGAGDQRRIAADAGRLRHQRFTGSLDLMARRPGEPGVLFRWGLIVAALLVLGSIPFFVGLAAVLPWLGYATWHLYTKLVDRSAIKSRRD